MTILSTEALFFLPRIGNEMLLISTAKEHETTGFSKQPIRTRYIGHVTGYQHSQGTAVPICYIISLFHFSLNPSLILSSISHLLLSFFGTSQTVLRLQKFENSLGDSEMCMCSNIPHPLFLTKSFSSYRWLSSMTKLK